MVCDISSCGAYFPINLLLWNKCRAETNYLLHNTVTHFTASQFLMTAGIPTFSQTCNSRNGFCDITKNHYQIKRYIFSASIPCLNLSFALITKLQVNRLPLW